MKITKEHFNYLKAAIEKTLQANPNAVELYETGQFPRADRVKDLQIRFNYDLLHASVKSSWISDNLYTYMNDDHITTALKRICPTVTKKY